MFGFLKIGITTLFLTNSGRTAMAGKHGDIIGKRKHAFPKSSHEFYFIAARKVATAYAVAEKAVSAEEHALFLAIKTNTAGRMAGRGYHLKRKGADGEHISVAEPSSHRWQGKGQVAMNERPHLPWRIFIGDALIG